MVNMCIVCKAEPNPQNKFRSFHKFPNNIELKKKWMEILKVSRTTNSSTVCSDHFDRSCYVEADRNCIRRRLLANATPKDTTNIPTEDEDIEKIEFLEELSECTVDNSNVNSDHDTSDDYILEEVLDDSETEAALEAHQKKYTNINPAKVGNKRKHPVKTNIPNKKRLIIDTKTEYLTREDFVSDESWTRFIQFYNQQQRKIKTLSRIKLRYRDKIDELKYLIKDVTKFLSNSS